MSKMSTSSGPEKTGFAESLTDWYQAGHRDLPWRNTHNPYHIWLSEIMLQQTQVRTVIDYYHRFLERYPSIQALAEAPLDDVLKLWEGLGYYARCRNLHKAAQAMVANHSGQFPQTLAEAEALPGIGRSTAGAILTFAYGQKHPLLDGNVKRVLSRVYDIEADIQQTATTHQMWQASEDLLSEAQDPYSYNQAIMELGATVCLPQNPRCLLCPVQEFCSAFAQGTQHERPVKESKKPTPHHSIGVGVIWHEGKVLIQQRPAEGLLGGLWEFPGGKQEPDEALPETVRREIEEELGIEVTVDDLITTVKHAYTHFRITLHAFHCTYKEGTPEPRACQGWKWVHPEELTQYAFPKANKTVLEKVLSEWRQQQTPPPDVSSPERAGEPPDEDVGAQQFDSPAEYI
jgi:A/G-specific adenine glycosylase